MVALVNNADPARTIEKLVERPDTSFVRLNGMAQRRKMRSLKEHCCSKTWMLPENRPEFVNICPSPAKDQNPLCVSSPPSAPSP